MKISNLSITGFMNKEPRFSALIAFCTVVLMICLYSFNHSDLIVQPDQQQPVAQIKPVQTQPLTPTNTVVTQRCIVKAEQVSGDMQLVVYKRTYIYPSN